MMKNMKSPKEIELGILPTFRLFTGVQLAITMLGLIAQEFTPSQSQLITVSAFNLLEPGLLLLYLCIPWLQTRLKSFYIPFGIIWAGIGLVIEPYFSGINQPDIPARWLWRQTLFLCVPLIVVSWRYSVRQLILFCTLTTALNISLLATFSSFQGMFTNSLLVVILIQLVLYLVVGNMILKFMKLQREQWQRLKEANEYLVRQASILEQLTISQERNRLARELHDVLAHPLSGVAVELEGMRIILRVDPERAQDLLTHSLEAIREGLTETRRALKELRAKPLEDLGLVLAVKALAESFADSSDLQVDLNIDHDLGDYSFDVQQCVYRITQEALANVVDHAQAQNAQITLKRDRNQLSLIVCDDGCGFDTSAVVDEHHYGLLGMHERAEMIGGKLSVASQAGKGTQVSFCYEVNKA